MGEFESIGFNAVANHITQFKNIDIVVAGGFHLDIARELERKGVSYLTITPNVTGTSNQNVYEQVMNGTIDLKMMNSSALAPMLEILGEDPSQLRALLAEQIAANPDVRPEILLAHIHQWQKGKPNLDNLIVAYDRSAHLWTVSLANQAGSLVHHRVFGVRVVGKKVAFLKVGNDGQFIEPLKPTAMQEIETYVTKKTREIVQQRAGSQNQYIGMLKVPFIVLLSVLMVVIASSCSFASHSGQPHTPTPHTPPTQEQTNPGAVDLNPSFSVTDPIVVAQMIDKNSSSDSYWSANNGNQQSVSLQPDPSNPGQKVVQWSWGVKNSIWFGWGINHWAGGAKSIDVQKQGVNNTVLEFTVWGTPGAQFDITFEDNSKTFEDGKQVMISGQPVGHQITVQSSDFITVAKGQRTVLIRMDTLQDMAKKNHIDFDFTQLKDIKFNSTGDIGTTATIYIAGAQLLNVKAYRQQGIGLLIFRGGANVGGKPLVNGVPGDDGNRFPSYSKIDRRIDSGNKPIGTLSYTSIYDNLEQDGVIGEWANLAKHGQIPYDTVEFGQAPSQTDEQYNDLAYNARLHDIVDGKFDNLLKERAQSIARYGGPVLERPLHEFNGTDWYKWSVNNKQDAQLFVEAWQHIVDKYKEYHATNVAFVFSPFALNNPADPNYTLVQYILGQIESSVSVIGIDAYNDTPGINANELLTGLLRAVQRFKKPVMLGETSSSASPAQQEQYWEYLGIDLHNGMYAQYGLIAVTIFDTAKEQNGTWQNFLLPLSVAKQWSVDPFFFSTHLLKLWVNRTHLTSFTMRNGTTVQLRQRYPDNSLMLPDNRARYDHIKNKFGGGLWGEIVAGLYIAIIEVMPLLHTPRKFYKAHGEGEGKGWRFAGVVGVLLSTVIAAAGTFLGLRGIDTIGIAGHMLVPIIAGLSANVIVHAVWNIVWNLKGNPERALTLPPSGGPGSQFFERVGFLSRLSVFWAHLSGSEMPRVAQSALEKKTLSFTEGEIKHTLFRDVIKRMSAHIELPLAKEGGRLIVAFPGNEAAFSVRANAPLHMEEDVTTYMDGVQKGIEFRTISSANQITLDDVLMDHVVVQRHLMYYNFNLRAIKDDLLAKLSGLSKLLQLVLEIGLKNHGISSIEQFQRIIQYGGEVTRWVDQQTGENVISLNKITLDSKNHYQWEIRVPRGMVVNFVEGRLTVQAPAGSTVSFTMRMSTDYPQLTPAPFNTIFNAEALKKMVYDKEFASRMERFSYLFYKEKVVAGSWFYLAGFSRDLEITAVEMWPSLSTQAKKLLLQSLLDLVEKHGSRRGLVLTSDEENNDYFIFRGIEEFRRLIDEGGNDEAAVFGLIDVLRAPEKVSRVYHPLHSEEPHEGDKGPLDGTFLLPPVISLFFDDVKNDIISKREFRSFMTEDNRRTIFENWNTIVELLQPYINSFNELMQSHAINRQAFIADLTATDDIDKTLQAYGILPDQWKALRGSLIVSYINWRDSAQGTGFGRYSEDVNVNLSVVVLEKMKEMVAVLRKMYSRRELKKSVEGMARLDEYISHDTFSDAQEIWKTVEKHYTVKLSVDEIRERMQQYLSNATLTLSEREMLLNLADDDGVTVKEFIGGVGTPKSIAHGILFNAVSLDEQGHPIPLMHTDDIYRAIFLDLPQQEYERILSNYFHRYPYGQKLEFGVLVLNSVLSGSYAKSRQFWNGKAAHGDENRQQLRRWNYHGEVIWNNVMNLLWASIMRQILAATDENGTLRSGYSKEYVTKLLGDIEEILRMKKAAGNLVDSELFSWKPGPESTQPQPIAFANDGTLQPGTPLQAWSHHALEMKLDEVLQRLAKNRLFANDPHYQQLYVSRARTAYRYLGLSLGGTKLAIGLIDGNNKLIDDKEIKWNDKLLQDLKKQAWTNGLTDDEIIKDVRAADTMMDFIAGEIDYFLDKNGLTNGEVRAITKISLAGSVDKEKGIFGSDMKTSNLPFDQYPFKEVLMKKLRERAPGVARGVRININNDAEGAGDGEDASIILLGTGVNGWMKDSNHVFGGRGLELGHNIIATSRDAQGHFHFTWVWNTSSGDHPIERGNAASEIIKKSGVMGKKYVSMGDTAFIEEYPSYPVIEWREGFRSASDLFGGQEIWERLGARIKEAGQNKSLSNREGYLKIGAVVGENNANLESALDSEAQNGNDAAIEFIKEIGDEIGRALGAFMAPYSNEKFLNRLILVSGIGQNFGKRSSRGDVFLAALKRANQEELRTFGISEEQARTLSAGIVRSNKGSEREIIPSQLPSDQEVLDTARHVRPSLLRTFFRLSWLARVKRIQLTRKRINLEANAIKTVLDNIVGGAVLAAPSTVGGADFNDYRYNWIRDAALVMMVLLKKYRQTEDRDLKEQIKLKLEEYRTFNIKVQKNSRGNLAQAKFFPDENPQPYTADTPEHPNPIDEVTGQRQRIWDDQYDGPALRAIAFIDYATMLLEEGKTPED
ncbi:MAG: glycoside hydrolase family 15 protein, partial [Endomicrobiales bacterium]